MPPVEKWKPGMHPHLIVGGPQDGGVVEYEGVRMAPGQFYCSIPGVAGHPTFWVKADRLEPLSIDEANRREAAWALALESARRKDAGTEPDPEEAR